MVGRRPPAGGGDPVDEPLPTDEGIPAATRPGPAPTTLRLAGAARRAIVAHGERDYPHECCGVLLGPDDGGDKRCTEAVPLANRREDDAARRRFLVDPAELARVARDAAGRGLEVLGFYHSHPDHPARPSAYDLEHATWPWYSSVIVAVARGKAGDLTSWTLAEDRAAYLPEPIVVDPPADA